VTAIPSVLPDPVPVKLYPTNPFSDFLESFIFFLSSLDVPNLSTIDSACFSAKSLAKSLALPLPSSSSLSSSLSVSSPSPRGTPNVLLSILSLIFDQSVSNGKPTLSSPFPEYISASFPFSRPHSSVNITYVTKHCILISYCAASSNASITSLPFSFDPNPLIFPFPLFTSEGLKSSSS